MSLRVIPVKEESYDLYDFIITGLKKAESYTYPKKMTSPSSKAKHFKKNNKEYHRIPNSLLRGMFKFNAYRSDGMKGIKLSSCDIHIWGLGTIELTKPVSWARTVRQITFREDRDVALHGMRIPRGRPIVFKDYSNKPLSQLEKEDPIFRYLKVNLVFTEYGFKKMCKLRDIIAYLEENPDLTRRELERMGVGFDTLASDGLSVDRMSLSYNKLWDLVVNYQKSLDVWIRAGSKPKDYKKGHYFLSNGQHRQRLKNEWSLPDQLLSSDVDAGKLKNQSFDSQVFEVTRSDRESFFS